MIRSLFKNSFVPKQPSHGGDDIREGWFGFEIPLRTSNLDVMTPCMFGKDQADYAEQTQQARGRAQDRLSYVLPRRFKSQMSLNFLKSSFNGPGGRELADLLTGRYAEAKKVIVVCDNLNTHTKGAFYEVFPPEQARKLVERIEFHYTPKHGSWLNIAENELSSMTRQCLKDRNMTDMDMLDKETSAWATNSNEKQRGVNWQFKIEEARRKLRSLYPNV
jgi:hypothetical protein